MLGNATCETSFSITDQPLEDVGLSRDGSRACMLADTLAWGVARDLPLSAVLPSLPFFMRIPIPSRGSRRCWVFIKWALWPFHGIIWWVNLRWSWHVGRLLQELEAGEKLSVSLTQNMGRRFPRFYLLGVARAEGEGRLATALPILARQLRFPSLVAGERRSALLMAGPRIIMTLYVILFITTTVMPKFDYIFEDLTGAPHLPLSPLFTSIGTGILWLFVGAFAVFLYSKLPLIGEYVLFLIPGVGAERRQLVLSDFAGSMAVYLRQGGDMVGAAAWSYEASRSPWMRTRIRRFAAALDRGDGWEDAWRAMGLGDGFESWVVKQAALREDPAAGFELMAQWLHQEIHFTTRRLNRWLEPCCTLLLATVVGLMAWQVFAALTDMVFALAGP